MNIERILEQHRIWLTDGDKGERADLIGEDLRGADLRGAIREAI